MKYLPKTVDEAFAIFVRFRSLEKVHAEMRKDFHDLGLTTVKRWARKHNWQKRAESLDKRAARGADPSANPLESLLDEIRQVRQDVGEGLDLGHEDPTTGHITTKHMDGKKTQAVYAYQRLVECEARLVKMLEDSKTNEGRNTTVDVIFGALMKHPKTKALFERSKFRAELLEIIDDLMVREIRRQAA